MKKLLFGAMLLMCSSCTLNSVNLKKDSINLKKGQMFYHHYGWGTETFIVKDINDNGVWCTDTEWLWSATVYISFYDLKTDKEYKALGMYPGYGIKPTNQISIPNPLDSLKPMDMFQMVLGNQLNTFIVQKSSKNALVVTSTEWLWSSNIILRHGDYNKTFYKYLGKYKAHR